jgi:hypothetical protein
MSFLQFGKLFVSSFFFVFRLIENIKIFYGSTDNRLSLKHKLHSETDSYDGKYKMFPRKNYILKQTHLFENVIFSLNFSYFFLCITFFLHKQPRKTQ